MQRANIGDSAKVSLNFFYAYVVYTSVQRCLLPSFMHMLFILQWKDPGRYLPFFSSLSIFPSFLIFFSRLRFVLLLCSLLICFFSSLTLS